VPEQIPTVGGPSTGTTTGDPTATSTEPLGVPWGEKNSIGDLDAPPAPIAVVQPVQEKIYEAYEVKAPVLIHKVAPDYPDVLRHARMHATVIVRCVIDKNGHVRDPQITVPAMPPFNAAVLNAIQQWRYTPGSRNGVAVETYLNVTVNFSLR
jgi:protein TonB